MGCFDWVNFEMDCPKCGELVDGFQSKSAECNLGTVDPTAVANMYSCCPKCKNWIELAREPIPPVEPRSDAFTLDEVKEMGFVIKEGL